MTPKIIFRYSNVYYEFLKTGLTKRKKFKYPSERTKKKVLNYIRKIEKTWKKDEKKVLKEISKITGLKWKEKYIYCYIVSEGNFALSDPMTLPIYKKPAAFIDLLVHELVHRIFVPEENFQKSKKAWKYIYRKYKNETERTKIHIVIHAIHNHIYLKLYNEKRLKRDIQWAAPHRDYRRAWEIVQKEGYQKIIEEFRKRIKK